MFTLGSSKSEYEPYYISDGCGDNFIYGTKAKMLDLRDQLIRMFPPEPVVDTSIDWAGERWEIAVDTPINWEARRWEAVLAVLGSISPHEGLHNQAARLSMGIADALIDRYRAEPEDGGGA